MSWDSAGSLQTKNNNIFSSLIKSSLVKLETSCTVILPPTVSVLWDVVRREREIGRRDGSDGFITSQRLRICVEVEDGGWGRQGVVHRGRESEGLERERVRDGVLGHERVWLCVAKERER